MTSNRPHFPRKKRPKSSSSVKDPPRAFWTKVCAEFSKSDLTVQGFCQLNHIAPSSFYAWRKRFREEGAGKAAERTPFIPLTVVGPVPSKTFSKEGSPPCRPACSPDMEEKDAGLSLFLHKNTKITLQRDFHGPTLKRLIHVLSSKDLSGC